MNFYSKEWRIPKYHLKKEADLTDQPGNLFKEIDSKNEALEDLEVYRVSLFVVTSNPSFHWLLRIHNKKNPLDCYYLEIRNDLLSYQIPKVKYSAKELHDIFRSSLQEDSKPKSILIINAPKPILKLFYTDSKTNEEQTLLLSLEKEKDKETNSSKLFSTSTGPENEPEDIQQRPKNENVTSESNGRLFFCMQNIIDKLVRTVSHQQKKMKKQEMEITDLKNNFVKFRSEIDYLKQYVFKLKEISKRQNKVILGKRKTRTRQIKEEENEEESNSDSETFFHHEDLKNEALFFIHGTHPTEREVQLDKKSERSNMLSYPQIVVLQAFSRSKKWELLYDWNSDRLEQVNLDLTLINGTEKLLFILQTMKNYVFGGYIDQKIEFEEPKFSEEEKKEILFSDYDPKSFIFTLRNAYNSPAMKILTKSKRVLERGNISLSRRMKNNLKKMKKENVVTLCFGKNDLKFNLVGGSNMGFSEIGGGFESISVSRADLFCGSKDFKIKKLEIHKLS